MLRHLRRVITTGVVALTTLGALSLPAAPASAISLDRAVKLAGHHPGSVVDKADVAAALRRVGHNYGSVVDDGDIRWLLDWGEPIRRVVDTALAQVGDPYRWGGTGPNAFDCSGLTSYVYRAAGVRIPRTSRAQARWTNGVSTRNLRPGDLLFFGRPVGHVAIYVGNGRFVDAPRPGYRVRVRTGLLGRRDLVKVGRVI